MVPTRFAANGLESSFRRLVAFLIILFVAVTVANSAPVVFDIPAQPAPAALRLFAKQSGLKVLFNEDLGGVTTKAVKGEFEPAEALKQLLAGTGYEAKPEGGKNFVIKKADSPSAGALKGSLTGEGGRPAREVVVSIRETGQSTMTDAEGLYAFPDVAAGTYVLVATAPGFQPLHIIDVSVRAGRETTLGRAALRKAPSGVTQLDPFVVRADTITELDKFEVSDTKAKPFSSGNVDLPRTINDIQPYYIFDAAVIEQSGTVNAEAFLKESLPMNLTKSTNTQNTTSYGTNSEVNLRGLGADRTLILVNGRRLPSATVLSSTYQSDINGIPVGQIERIEVLPTSASGIYGASALGGVINIILKRNYTGGDISVRYGNTFDSDASTRAVMLNWGTAFDQGRTRVRFSIQRSDGSELLLGDRANIVRENVAKVIRNLPDYLYTQTSPFGGATTNIANSTTANLVLKDGRTLNSRITNVAPGTGTTVSQTDLGASLLARAGAYNTDLPYTNANPLGLGTPYGFTPELKAYSASVSRDLTKHLEVFADYSYGDNLSAEPYNSWTGYSSATIAATAPTNPFTTSVVVKFPAQLNDPRVGRFLTRTFSTGLKAMLPYDWVVQLDYGWSQNLATHSFSAVDTTALGADLNAGLVNPFVDTKANPISLEKYRVPYWIKQSSTLNDLTLRASGPLVALPWGKPNLTTGLETRQAGTGDGTYTQIWALTPSSSSTTTYYGLKQRTESAYAELQSPLVARGRFPGLYALDVQASGRAERFEVATGTPSQTLRLATGVLTYNSPTKADGTPFRSSQTYDSTNGTVGLKYQPIKSLTFRASFGTAFQPPTASQLQRNLVPSTTTTTISDPKTGTSYGVYTVSGGNPDLSPQTAKSYNAGVIWQPASSGPLKGLRVNLEWYRIKQQNAIGSLSAQQIVNSEASYPGRVTRDSTGAITLVDISSLNLYGRDLKGLDFSLSYSWDIAPASRLDLNVAESYVISSKTQYSLSLPAYEGVDYPSDTSTGGALRYKTSVSLAWEYRRWSFGANSTLYSRYHAYGAAGGPLSLQYSAGADYSNYVAAQGSEWIPSQHYEDVTLGYRFERFPSTSPLRWMNGTSVRVGVKNVFNKVPPFDVSPWSYQGYISTYGSPRLREYWLMVRKVF